MSDLTDADRLLNATAADVRQLPAELGDAVRRAQDELLEAVSRFAPGIAALMHHLPAARAITLARRGKVAEIRADLALMTPDEREELHAAAQLLAQLTKPDARAEQP
ncbi:hypothetical protein [Bailinhaonella thermotolerans]|uniref:Uncharacterized protein n=1 Tax=Bailinhaonella thermotolerans TaxID=1070861 RepID=A0A3A3ZY66_9ACTN|nr:hypothetical protein [Bailinhaonella thermotolerans]RJL19737.1 hypothetical protein D5H75_40130 [Bailinhaonella thermotolerans]